MTPSMLEALPGKRPLIKLTYRPPNYETPLSHFTSEFTANESFFVRYHLAGIPKEIEARLKLKVGGEGVVRPLELSLSELRSDFDSIEIAAVCQCSGNRRGFSDPHVAGVPMGDWRSRQRCVEIYFHRVRRQAVDTPQSAVARVQHS